jgi:hypothetical protein
MNQSKYLIIIIIFTFILSCSQEMKLTKEEKENYSEKGEEIVQLSFKTLKTHLISAIETEGIGNSIKYCNIQAFPILDSLSKEYGVEIRRTSLKVRNPKNKPLNIEEDILTEFQEKYKKGEILKPVLKKYQDGRIVFYSPIIIDNPICLNCHGPNKIMITKTNEQIINSLYPTDEATGYIIGDFRGMWIVKFKAK